MSEQENTPLDPLDSNQNFPLSEEKKEENILNLTQKEAEKKEESILSKIIENVESEKKQENILSFEIESFDDMVHLSIEKDLDYIRIEPIQEDVEISFVKEGKEIGKKMIKYPLYSQIILTLKNSSGMNLAETTKVQDGSGEYIFE